MQNIETVPIRNSFQAQEILQSVLITEKIHIFFERVP